MVFLARLKGTLYINNNIIINFFMESPSFAAFMGRVLGPDSSRFTHCGATHEDDYEGAEDASNTDHPGHPKEEDYPKNVLDTRQVDSHQGAQLRRLRNRTITSETVKTLKMGLFFFK